MLLELFKEPPPYLLTSMGGGPYKGEKPASEGTGQAEACLARPAITARKQRAQKKRLLFTAMALSRLRQYSGSHARPRD